MVDECGTYAAKVRTPDPLLGDL